MAYPQFDRVPNHYAGPTIERVKNYRLKNGKRSLCPTLLEIGQLQILIPRHFGFCFGVERAIHMAFSALQQHPDRKAYLVNEIIHNPLVNNDLKKQGVRFIYDSEGERQVAADELSDNAIAFIPAFGTTMQVEEWLGESGIDIDSKEYRENYDTTCPFVAKVWKRGEELARQGYTIIIHGKYNHAETQATNSHTGQHTKTLVVLDAAEAEQVAAFITGDLSLADFERIFADKTSADFDPQQDLQRVAVVNQTTMLAEETQQVNAILRRAMRQRYGEQNLDHHCADTSDTLCYATHQNQNATHALLSSDADLALVVGGYNSSNTSHLVELCCQSMPSFLIANSDEILSAQRIRHFDIHSKEITESAGWLPRPLPARIIITSGASCPDILMDQVLEKVAGLYGYSAQEIEDASLQIFERSP